MIRLALTLSIVSFIGFTVLPKWRARISTPFHTSCLKFVPNSKQKSEIQSLVCGSSLKNLTGENGWKNLGLIHILVVSGGHLLILSALLSHAFHSHLAFRIFGASLPRVRSFVSTFVLLLFALANRLEPPVLRAFLEWKLGPAFLTRGWRKPEIALMTTWIALPFSSESRDLLSLALSFFASIAIHAVPRFGTRPGFLRRGLQALSLQITIWWLMLPWIFAMGLPHPVSTLTGILLAPLLGATLIPLAMTTTLLGALSRVGPTVILESSLAAGYAFDQAWWLASELVGFFSNHLPAPSSKLSGVRIFALPSTLSAIFMLSFLSACGALLLRAPRKSREQTEQGFGKNARFVFWALVAACALHRAMGIRN